MRLINIDELKGCAIIRPHSREDMKAIKSCSEVIPHNEIATAYDIDKVVERLKAFNNTLRDPLENRAIEDAIEMVKGGAE